MEDILQEFLQNNKECGDALREEFGEEELVEFLKGDDTSPADSEELIEEPIEESEKDEIRFEDKDPHKQYSEIVDIVKRGKEDDFVKEYPHQKRRVSRVKRALLRRVRKLKKRNVGLQARP